MRVLRVELPKDIAMGFTVIKLNTPKTRIFQELYDQIIAPVILLKYSIEITSLNGQLIHSFISYNPNTQCVCEIVHSI